jgi:hypothetical protein
LKAFITERNSLSRNPICFSNSFFIVLQHKHRFEHSKRRSIAGTLTTSLAEDVLSLLRTEATVLHEYLAEAASTSETVVPLADCCCHLLQEVQQVQKRNRILFLTTFEDACAAANDFYRLSDGLESFIPEICDLLSKDVTPQSLALLQIEGEKTVELFSQDAVMATERTQMFIMRSVQKTSIPTDFFSKAWEDDWTQNEVAVSMIEIFGDYLPRAKRYLANEYLYHKALAIAAKAMACCYVRCLVSKADAVTKRHNRNKRFRLPGGYRHCLPFKCHNRAMRRIADDIFIFKEYLHEQAAGNTPLTRVVLNEMQILELILECLCADDTASLESFILVLHKQTGGDPLVTRYFVGDLWMLTSHKQGRKLIHQTVQQLEPDLQMVTTRLQERTVSSSESDDSFVHLDDMLKAMYEDRAAQGILPACWACLPKIETEGDYVIVNKQIRTLARKVENFKMTVSKHGKR